MHLDEKGVQITMKYRVLMKPGNWIPDSAAWGTLVGKGVVLQQQLPQGSWVRIPLGANYYAEVDENCSDKFVISVTCLDSFQSQGCVLVLFLFPYIQAPALLYECYIYIKAPRTVCIGGDPTRLNLCDSSQKTKLQQVSLKISLESRPTEIMLLLQHWAITDLWSSMLLRVFGGGGICERMEWLGSKGRDIMRSTLPDPDFSNPAKHDVADDKTQCGLQQDFLGKPCNSPDMSLRLQS